MMDQSHAEAAARLRGIANGLRASQALFVAAQLGIADHLSKKPLNSSELAAITGSDPAALGRVMRALCALGIFSELDSGHFSLNPVAQLLRSDVPGSYRAGVLFLAGTVRWRCWSGLLETVKAGVEACERVLGKPLFDFYAAHPEESKVHDDAMRAFSASHGPALLDAIDLRQADVVVDVGGGTGEWLAAILVAHPDLHGVLFDLPNVVAHAGAVLSRNKVADRCTIESGSFFEHVPGNGDTYLLKQVVHDWDDARASHILRCCRRCMPQKAKLLIIDRLMPEFSAQTESAEVFFVDLEMLVMTSGGRERTEAEFRKLLADSGFKHLRTLSTDSPLCIFEVLPA